MNIYRQTNVDNEMQRMKDHHQSTRNNSQQQGIKLKDLMTKSVMKPFGISLGIMFFQQATGINAMVFYTVSIFQTAGSSIDSRYATIIVGAVQLVFTVASGFFVSHHFDFN